MPWLVVFDTNVLLSAIGWRGVPHQLLQYAREGSITAITCPEILTELVEKLESRLHFPVDWIADVIADLLGFMQVMSIPGALHGVSPDPDDDAVIECALVAGATYIITGDKRHLLPLDGDQGLAILTPRAFLDLLAQQR